MKVLSTAAIAIATLSELAAAHYRFNFLTANGVKAASEYQYIRKYTSYNSPVTDLSSNDLRCNVGGHTSGPSTDTVTVSAGSSVTFTLDQAVYHQGPISWYMSKAPGDVKQYDGSGGWFKIAQEGPTFNGGSAQWPLKTTYTATIPRSISNGEYLLRIEQIGLHNPGAEPQFYISCAQVRVTGGGNANPPTVRIPGHLTKSDPSLTVNIYQPGFTSYKMPGPAVFSG